MIHGAVIRSATVNRTIAESVTIPASHAATGTARTSASDTARPRTRLTVTLLTEAGLAEPRADLRSRRCAGRDSGAGRRRGDLRDHRLPDGRSAGGLFERRGVELADTPDRMLTLGQLPRGTPHLFARAVVRAELDEHARQDVHLSLVGDDLGGYRVRELREPAHVADDERLAQRQRADRAPGRLPHRRRAEVHAHVAARHQRVEAALLDE